MMRMLEVRAEIAATKAALAGLRKALNSLKFPQAPRSRHSKVSVAYGDELRSLDQLLAAHTGTQLSMAHAPRYPGPMYEWLQSRDAVTRTAIASLIRLRRSSGIGVHMNTHFVALNYLAAIWPADLEWPADIPRPTPKKEAA